MAESKEEVGVRVTLETGLSKVYEHGVSYTFNDFGDVTVLDEENKPIATFIRSYVLGVEVL